MDALAKRHFSKIVLALIAACAWFQAVGFSHLLAAELSWPSAPTRRQGSVIHVSSEPLHETSAAPILARNAFDSITGPLDDRGREVPALPALPPADDPYADPICGSLRTTFIASSEDEAWSFAVLAQASASAELYRRGDAVPGAGTVVHIAWDRVWLQDGSGRCQVELHGKDPPVSKPGPITPSKSGGSNLPPEIASKIRRVSETQLVVDRSVIDLVLERQA